MFRVNYTDNPYLFASTRILERAQSNYKLNDYAILQPLYKQSRLLLIISNCTTFTFSLLSMKHESNSFIQSVSYTTLKNRPKCFQVIRTFLIFYPLVLLGSRVLVCNIQAIKTKEFKVTRILVKTLQVSK